MPPSRGTVGKEAARYLSHLQLFLNALVLLGLGETVLLHAVIVDAVDVQVGAVCAVILLTVAVVVRVVVHGGRRRRRGCHHYHVQLISGLLQILLGFLCLVQRWNKSITDTFVSQ